MAHLSDLSGMVEGYLQNFAPPGSILIVNHLQSEKGRAMNGKRVVVLGVSPSKKRKSKDQG